MVSEELNSNIVVVASISDVYFQFRQSNIQLVMAKLGPLIAQARLDDFVSNSNLPLEQFFEIIRNISEGRVSIQEMITVARCVTETI